jgi:hypothetical protein
VTIYYNFIHQVGAASSHYYFLRPPAGAVHFAPGARGLMNIKFIADGLG